MQPHVEALTVALAKTGVTFFECVCPNVFKEVDAALSNVRIGGGGGDGSDSIPCAKTTRSDSDWGKAKVAVYKWQNAAPKVTAFCPLIHYGQEYDRRADLIGEHSKSGRLYKAQVHMAVRRVAIAGHFGATPPYLEAAIAAHIDNVKAIAKGSQEQAYDGAALAGAADKVKAHKAAGTGDVDELRKSLTSTELFAYDKLLTRRK
jgi:hypothetical protein